MAARRGVGTDGSRTTTRVVPEWYRLIHPVRPERRIVGTQGTRGTHGDELSAVSPRFEPGTARRTEPLGSGRDRCDEAAHVARRFGICLAQRRLHGAQVVLGPGRE